MKTGYFTSEITNVCEEALMNTVMEPLFSLTTCITSVDMMSMCSKGLDVLVNNAGVMALEDEATSNGYEM